MNAPRAQLLSKRSPNRELPDVIVAPYLIQYAHELGLQKNTGMGVAPIEWVDIKAWAQLTGTELYPEESKILRELSFHYVSQYNISKAHDCPAPEND